ncbi:MAG: aldehyde dehydrogenase family protein [Azospira oryzae]|nr:MAG: aldehyde dehydrogenase family protein [Azospira oryzae]
MSENSQNINIQAIQGLFQQQKEKALRLRVEPLQNREVRLKKIETWILGNQEELQKAIFSDFGKPYTETTTSEIFPVLAEIRHTLAHLHRWAAPTKIDAPLTYLGTRSEIRYEPKGVCLLIAPWNYPFNLCIGPLISCLAAGNTAIIKPSEMTPHTSALIKKMIASLFSEEEVSVIEGGAEVTTELLSLPFDHLFFTGSPAIGKVVMKAAAEHLTSVTLELGGKSPTVIDETAHLNDAARRIAFGKFINNGQTCIAPDYVLIHESKKEKFISLLNEHIQSQFGGGKKVDENSQDYARIVSQKHFQRIDALVQDAVQKGATIELEGSKNERTRFLSPIILSNVSMNSRIMEEEIFGPVLPIITYSNDSEVATVINSKPKPLGMYIFSNNKKFRESLISSTSAGAVCINDCVIQFTHPDLPFGGVNNSGIGKAHGHYGFLSFSNEKPSIRQKRGLSSTYFFYPPYTPLKKKLIDFILRWVA